MMGMEMCIRKRDNGGERLRGGWRRFQFEPVANEVNQG